MAVQDDLNAYSAYKAILASEWPAYILLAGVGLTSCTPVHFAEELSGKRLFRRWALRDGAAVETEVGSCSDGFGKLDPFLVGIERRLTIGESTVRVYAFRSFALTLAGVLRDNPGLTICEKECLRCRDTASGGPLL